MFRKCILVGLISGFLCFPSCLDYLLRGGSSDDGSSYDTQVVPVEATSAHVV